MHCWGIARGRAVHFQGRIPNAVALERKFHPVDPETKFNIQILKSIEIL